jgi:hypothetical protein
MEPEDSLQYSQQPATGPYPAADESSPYLVKWAHNGEVGPSAQTNFIETCLWRGGGTKSFLHNLILFQLGSVVLLTFETVFVIMNM